MRRRLNDNSWELAISADSSFFIKQLKQQSHCLSVSFLFCHTITSKIPTFIHSRFCCNITHYHLSYLLSLIFFLHFQVVSIVFIKTPSSRYEVPSSDGKYHLDMLHQVITIIKINIRIEYNIQ